MILCTTWELADKINFAILIVYFITAIVIFITFWEGKKQTKISSSIGQYNIMKDEFSDFLEDAKNLKFNSKLIENADESIKPDLQNVNGIDYIPLFMFATDNTVLSSLKKGDNDENKQDFRHNIIFPLERYYDKLYNYILSVVKDEILEQSHKDIILKKIERDILQTYFRVCNYGIGINGENFYQIHSFKTEKFNPDSFYRINKLYTDKKLWQYKNLEFYQETT
jgi:hypothetical protein